MTRHFAVRGLFQPHKDQEPHTGGWAVSDLDALRAEVMEMRDAATRYLDLAPGDLSAQVSRNCCDVFLGLIDKYSQEGQ